MYVTLHLVWARILDGESHTHTHTHTHAAPYQALTHIVSSYRLVAKPVNVHSGPFLSSHHTGALRLLVKAVEAEVDGMVEMEEGVYRYTVDRDRMEAIIQIIQVTRI